MRRPKTLSPGRIWALAAFLLGVPAHAQPLDTTPRTAVISAFPPEIGLLKSLVANAREVSVNGTPFTLGTIEGRPVLLFLSGVSMVNAAMTTQSALDRFKVTRIVFSGVAGGVDPGLTMGDVIVPERWSEYLEATFARADGKGGFVNVHERSTMPQFKLANYGMIHPSPVLAVREGEPPRPRLWFDADPAMLEVARDVAATLKLDRCHQDMCLTTAPKLVVGGNGVSGAAFVDNAEFRKWTYATFQARVLDMESAAVAHVAYSNKVPFIAFRSLSDLAGGDAGPNQARAFYRISSDNSAKMVQAFLKALP